jgi:AraC-like DNA-binding protein
MKHDRTGIVAPQIVKVRFDTELKPFYIGVHGGKQGRYPVYTGYKSVHIHTGLELGCIISGTGRLFFNGREYPLAAHDVFFVDSTIPHMNAGTDMVMIVVHITTESVINAHPDAGDTWLLKPFLALRSGIAPVLKNRPDIIALLKQGVKHENTHSRSGRLHAWFCVCEALVEIAGSVETLLQERFGPDSAAGHSSILSAMEYINQHFNEDISLRELAAYVNISPWHFAHLFKEYANTSPIEYRNNIRLVKALQKIRTSGDKISSIAADCGFKSLSQFHRLFKKLTGRRPDAFRSTRT